jgi:hypothetical protein
VDAILNLKSKVITDVEKVLDKLDRGYTEVNYCNILQCISFIQNVSKIDKVTSLYEKLYNQ